MKAKRSAIRARLWQLALATCVLGAGSLALGAESKTAPAAKPEPKQRTPDDVEKRIHHLIGQLGDKDYAVRERAQEELAKFGFLAFDALNAAANHEDFEIASRVRYLLRLIRSQWTTENDPAEARQLLERYELLPIDERARRISRLVRMPGGGGIPALCRLIRFEKLSWLSGYAAMQILYHEPMDRDGWTRLAKALRENLLGSQRPPAQWLLSYVRLREDPKSAMEAWARLAEAEVQAAGTGGDQSPPGVASLLVYLLADAQARLDDPALADRTAEQARKLGGGADPAHFRVRLQNALALRRRGRFAWAEAEYRQVADAAPALLKVHASIYLSEMLHDRGEHLRAAEARRTAHELLAGLSPAAREQLTEELLAFDMDPSEVPARMNYFYACHWQQQGDRAKQRKYLEEAIRANAFEADTLIALHRLPDPSPADSEKTRKLVEKAVEHLRREVQQSPDDPVAYNQAAWLMGNTRVSVDEALKLAHKAVALDPDNGAYLDTLAHVCFVQGDLDGAVRYQTRAAEVEPHSGMIQSELKVFRAAQQERSKQPKTPSTPNRKG